MGRDALVVGINRYRQNSGLDDLPSSARDAEAIAQILENYGGFNVTRLPEVPTGKAGQVGTDRIVKRKQLMDAIAHLFEPDTETQAPTTALLYFSGHGWTSNKCGYLASGDAKPHEDWGVDFMWLRGVLERSNVPEQVVWLDCCNSGSFLNFDGLTSAGRKGHARHFLTSSRDFEASYNDLMSPYGVLTKAILDGLDPNNTETGEVTTASLTAHLEQAMKGQTQRSLCESKGTPILLTFGGTVRPEPLPAAPPRQRWDIPLQLPPLPEHFVERPSHQQAVKARLLSEDPKVFGTLVVSAIHGLGGIGKSVLASKLAHDKEVQARFSDGVLWATLGQNPDLLPLLSGWIQALGDHDYKPTAVEPASAHLRTLLYDKKVLLVVDDIWKPGHLEPFRVGGSQCCVLVTTREVMVADAYRYPLDEMSPEQALELITQKLPEPLSEAETQQALDFARQVGHLPLALELAATQIEEGVTWEELLEDFGAERGRLETLDLYGKEDIPDDAKRRKYSLLACFNLSLKQLSLEQLRYFAWLGVVPEDVTLTQEMATTLWQVTARQAGAILRQFSGKALLLPGTKQGNKRSYRLHDLMHDLAQRLLTDPPKPEQAGDLSGLGLTKAAAHGQLLARYRAKTQGGQWHTLPDDGYIFAQLTWHMEQARQPDEVYQLLAASSDAGRNGWYEACDALGKPAGFVNDVGRGWRLAVEEYEQDQDPRQDNSTALARLFRYALIRTSINSLASNVPAALVGALVKVGIWQPAQGLAYAQQMQDPWRRAECVAVLVPYIPEGLLPEVLKTVGWITDMPYRSFVLSKLAERFPQLWPEVLEARESDSGPLWQIIDSSTSGFSYRAYALTELVDKLPAEFLPKALGIAQQIQDESDRSRALSELAKQLPELLPEALEVTRQIQSRPTALSLSELAKQLPPSCCLRRWTLLGRFKMSPTAPGR